MYKVIHIEHKKDNFGKIYSLQIESRPLNYIHAKELETKLLNRGLKVLDIVKLNKKPTNLNTSIH